MNRFVMISALLLAGMGLKAQEMAAGSNEPHPKEDTAKPKMSYLQEITVVGRGSKSDIQQMPEIVGTSIYAGKKNALIVMDNVQGNVVTNTMRQVMAKVPGIHVWESDGSGIQIGIAARGLSPNRSWEFNVRQNGYDIAADPFGYPEAYYNPQLQAVQRIEVVRGQGALQYGPQFGGMVNYILRNGSEFNKPFQFETQQTIGSYGLFNSYNAIGGETAKFHYYGFFDHRNADGWRQNGQYYTNNGFGTFTWKFNPKFSLTAEVMHHHMRQQQPGGLTDADFNKDARQSFRSRNWFDIKWTTAALIGNYKIDENQRINVKLFGMFGDRNSVGYLRAINVKDSINAATMDYNNRTVDIDQYRNFGMEARYLGDYYLGKMRNTLSGGIRLYKGNTDRFRDGKGTTGSGYDVTLVDGIWPRDIDFESQNAAVFVENIFRLSDKFIIVPGVRYEWLKGTAGGRNGYASDGSEILLVDQEKSRGFFLAGVGTEYHVTEKTEFYGNITQAYRPIQFADLTTPPTTDVIDPNLTDAKGFNADLGYRGKIKDFLFFDASVYYLQYNDRIGSITQQRQDGSFYNYRTNVGDSRSKGFEGLVEFSPVKAFLGNTKPYDLSLFASYSYNDARYESLKVVVREGSNLVEKNLKNNYVENAPMNILRAGITATYKGLVLTGQLSYVDRAYADANNTVTPSANGQNGLIPSYTIGDIAATYTINKQFNIKAGVNNIADTRYFTRRAGGYPGPGLLPADGRNFFVSFGARF
ncbi:TonB-dependent receptor [Flavihumibacter rivuli]|uniref:TonB-dependent receptor family protein n=1 Tax=Flavihumibacter rivuli TaxID=2838156 RepID=UPI001BDDCD3F|nr:TonB-dependent receptor [Flavihumibacter rivuli]ULQ55047.1 TonB-dependent receptor [Flavihumibacter rivuli]